MKVNGKIMQLQQSQSLTEFLVSAGYADKPIVVEHNGQVVQRTCYQNTMLQDADKLEIVCLVAGG